MVKLNKLIAIGPLTLHCVGGKESGIVEAPRLLHALIIVENTEDLLRARSSKHHTNHVAALDLDCPAFFSWW
jgi:hypothetical protein